ncbi:hypothetical protein ACFGVS_28270 [Mucilaginibacter sp. AW1-7]|uniref:hypothetical protein n=1 Tax=Mucilaginibacter sp. AW1-7 TaxID=3349874 RepID=UPI003F736320
MKLSALISTIALLFILTSCEQATPKTELQKKMELDSFSKAKYGESSDEHVKKMVDATMAKALLDTIGLYKAPVKVLSAKIVKEEYSSYRNVHLKYKNVSGKTIAAIKFNWYGVNAFNEPADLGNSYAAGFGGGFTDDALKPGHSDDGTWSVLSRDAKKIKIAWPTEVSFTDGTTWKIKYSQSPN